MKAAKKTERTQTAAGKACAEGLRLFKVAGRPTKEQVVLVYGERGPVVDAARSHPVFEIVNSPTKMAVWDSEWKRLIFSDVPLGGKLEIESER